jgi:hypothetical protein
MTGCWDWAPLFLDALGRSGLVRASARAVGIGRRTADDRRARDTEFAAAWEAALAPFRCGDRRYDRAALAPFPNHAALAPLDKISAQVGAVSVAELEAAFGNPLDQLADQILWYGHRGDPDIRRIARNFSDKVRALADRRGCPAAAPHMWVKRVSSCAREAGCAD